MVEQVSSVGTLYELGHEQGLLVPNGGGAQGFILNTRDLLQPGASDYVLLGPGSQVWYVGYAIEIFPSGGAPALPHQFIAQLSGSFDTAIPFVFGTLEEWALPVYAGVTGFYQGWARGEAPALAVFFLNRCGVDCTVSFQCWGKAF